MSAATHLHFDTFLGRQKPESIRNRETKCPFCERDSLEGIIASEGPMLLLKNKYPVLQDAFQTVLIETEECDSELSIYPREHLHQLIRFGVDHWLEMERSGEYASVLFFKSHGPQSGGTLRHPHMQIVGLRNVDYHQHTSKEQFEGLLIDQKDGVEFTISTKPRMGFNEFNVILAHLDNLPIMADYIQVATHYILNHFHKNSESYNLFFYQLEGTVYAKIVPRFVVSPLFVGYSIPQVSNRLEDVVGQMQNLYFK
jgi:galactose-1-phosphate uridylyltransferase